MCVLYTGKIATSLLKVSQVSCRICRVHMVLLELTLEEEAIE